MTNLLKRWTGVAAILVMGIAGVVLYGWLTRNAVLIQIHPSFAPMQFNTALCFLCAALALILLDTRWRFLASGLAGILTLVCAATLLQDILGVNLGIDELFRRADVYVAVATSPGRMATFTAGCFMALGIALLLAGLSAKFPTRFYWAGKVTGVSACVVTCIAGVVLVGYLLGHEPAYTLGAPSRMAFHTAVAFLLLGSGLLVWSRRSLLGTSFADFPNWMAVTASLTMVVMMGVVLAAGFADLSKSVVNQKKSFVVLTTARSLVGNIFAAQHGMRGFILSSRPEGAQLSQEGLAGSAEMVQKLRELVVGNVEQEARLDIVAQDVNALTDYLEGLRETYEKQGLESALAMESSGEGYDVVTQARTGLESFLRAETQALAERTTRTAEHLQGTARLLLACSIVTVLLIFWANYRMVKELRRRRQAEKTLLDDIQEREEGARLLAESKAQLTAIFESSLSGIILVQAVRDDTGAVHDFRYDMVNRAAERMIGLSSSDLVGRTMLEMFPSVGEEKLFQDFIQVVLRGESLDEEYRSLRAGMHRWYRIAAAKTGDGLVINYIEITSQKQGDERLKALTERLRLATEVLHVGVWEHDVRTSMLILDKTIYELYGFPENKQISYQEWSELVVPEDLARIESSIQLMLSTRIPTAGEFRIRRLDGAMRHIEMAAGVLMDESGEPTRLIGINLDVTEERAAREALRLSEEKFTNAFAYSTCGMALVAPSGQWLQVNNALCQSLGYEAEELCRKTFQDITHPEDLEQDLAFVTQLLAGEIDYYKMEKRYFHRDGRIVWVLLGVTLMRDNQGQPLYFIAQIEDITAMKKALFRQEELTREAQSAMRAKSDFLAIMSHEIRTPLNGVLGMISLLGDTPLDTTQLDFLKTIKTSGDTLLHIINDILDYSRIDAGRMQMENKTFQPDRILAEVLDLFQAQLRLKNLKLTWELTPEVSTELQGDALHLRQILTNLIGNAIKFTDQGAISIRMERQASSDQKFHLLCSVTDTGIGIPAEGISLLFEPFQQVDTSMTRRYGGSGLGLAISQKLAHLIGGKIWVESEAGVGSTFYFTSVFSFPSTMSIADEGSPMYGANMPKKANKAQGEGGQAPDASVRSLSSARSAPVQFGLKVLLAEDNSTNQKVATMMLERMGCQVDLAENGKQALEAVKRQRYDLVLMDVHMPVMDGVEALHAIQECKEISLPPIFAVTADALSGDEKRYLDAGFDGYLSKPITQDRLRKFFARVFTKEETEAPE